MNALLYLATDNLARKMAASAKAVQLELSPEDGSPERAALALEDVQDAATELLEIIARHKATGTRVARGEA